MKKKHMIVCGWCYATIKDSLPVRILGGCQTKDRCAFCNRPVEFNAYVVEIGDEGEKEVKDAEDNERRPGNYRKSVS